MKKVVSIVVVAASLAAASFKTSPITPAATEFLSLYDQECFTGCQKDLVKRGEFASFLANFDETSTTNELRKLAEALNSNEISPIKADLNLAVIIPQKTIGVYARTVSRAILSFAATSGIESKIKLYLTNNENSNSLISAVRNAAQDGFGVILAPLTTQGVAVLDREEFENLKFIIPTISKDIVQVSGTNFIFGGISYAEQLKLLLSYSTTKIATINNNDSVALRMLDNISAFVGHEIYNITLEGQSVRLGGLISGNQNLKQATIFLNTPVHKTSVAAAQLRSYGFEKNRLLSTQINYNPAVVADTQGPDVKNLLIANSLDEPLNEDLVAKANLLGVDLNFERIAYTTALSTDYLFDTFFNGENRSFTQRVNESQMQFNTTIMQPSKYGFKPTTQKPLNAVEIVTFNESFGLNETLPSLSEERSEPLVAPQTQPQPEAKSSSQTQPQPAAKPAASGRSEKRVF